MAQLFSDRILHEIEDTIKNANKKLEIEARFRGLKDEQIARLEEYLKKSSMEVKTSFTIDYYKDDVRITEEDGKFFIMKKKNILNRFSFITGKDIKISVSEEIIGDEVLEPENYDFSRIKDRVSYIEDNYSLDITKVKEKGIEKKEIELEVIDSDKFNIDEFITKINFYYTIMEDKNLNIVRYITKVLDNEVSDDIHDIYKQLSRARDLLPRDMTSEGLLKNYSISIKADGEQKLLVLLQGNAYFVYPRKKDAVIFISSINSDLNNCIFAGEWIEKEKLFLPFDTLIFNNQDVRGKNYLERREYCKNIYDMMLKDIIVKEKIIFTYDNNVKSFYETCRKALEYENNAPYETDGLIFTPIESGYIALGQTMPSDKRILSIAPDVCKYKTPENLTVDFLVRKSGLYTKEGLFEGTKEYPFTSENYIYNEKYLNKIVEFTPIHKNGIIVYQPKRIREDKSMPNKLKVVLDNWRLVHKPIELDTMKGENIQLMRLYHNQIKKNLISKLSGYVIDIGSGAGGDISKYLGNKNIKKVLSFEPNEEFAKEFIRRRDNLTKEDKVKLIIAKGEDTDIILEESEKFFPDFNSDDLNICFNISLSFFFSSDEELEKLEKTIKTIEKFYNGTGQVKISYLTIEGERLKNLFQERGDTIKLNNIILKKLSNNEVYIDIINSVTVKEQTEYFVDLNKLWQNISFSPYFEREANNNVSDAFMLSENEITYSKLFVYGIAVKDKSKKKNYIQEYTNKCIPVNEKKGIKTEKGIFAKGDDDMEPIENNPGLYRLGTMNTPNKLYHSLLKLLSNAYREGDVYKRLQYAKNLKDKLRDSLDLQYISKKLDHGIKIINTGEIISPDKEKFIIFYQCDENIFEPVIFQDDKTHFAFAKNSYLL